jgi:NADH-quinone oxidoreductase subunit M
MPWFSTLFVIASLSSIGLPFLNGFVGEFLILIGTWTSRAVTHSWIVTMFAATGVIWAAVYMLWMLQRVVFGKITNEENASLLDLNKRELGLIRRVLREARTKHFSCKGAKTQRRRCEAYFASLRLCVSSF